MPRPNIQIDDDVREMTEEEFAEWQNVVASTPKITIEETPTE